MLQNTVQRFRLLFIIDFLNRSIINLFFNVVCLIIFLISAYIRKVMFL